MSGPEFIGIGVPRSGTTWLAVNLRQHPNIFMPPVKELRYFKGNRTREKQEADYQKKVDRRGRRTAAESEWLEKWVSSEKHDDDWYRGLFPKIEGQISGEISPAYCALGLKGVRRVKKVIPDAKILINLRNPVTRDWSHAIFTLHHAQKKPFPLSIDEYKEFFDSPFCSKRSNYIGIYTNWEKVFGKEKLILIYHDDIENAPVKTLRNICHQLDLKFDKRFFSTSRKKKVNTSKKLIRKQVGYDLDLQAYLPVDLYRYLCEKHLAWLPEFEALVGGFASDWRKRAEAALISFGAPKRVAGAPASQIESMDLTDG